MAAPWDASSIRAVIETVLWHVPDGGWANWLLGNHDEIRLSTRLGPLNARLAAMLLLTLRGTPFLYYGDELGMPQSEIDPEEGRDPWGENVSYLGRDGCRTPMQWDDSPAAGFSSNGSWLPVDPSHQVLNVAAESGDPGSMLALYQRLLAYRKSSVVLREGKYLSHPASSSDVLVFERFTDDARIIVALNLSDQLQLLDLPRGTIVISTNNPTRRDVGSEGVFLGRREGVIIEVSVQ
jgi:alpha-glucosidase